MDRVSFQKGTIVVGENRKWEAARHPIIYWSDKGDGSFLGLVLTHSDRRGNIKMQSNHFQNGGTLMYYESSPTYVVPCLFVKPTDWGPYKEVSKVSDIGLRFIEENIKFNKPVDWEDFIRNSS